MSATSKNASGEIVPSATPAAANNSFAFARSVGYWNVSGANPRHSSATGGQSAPASEAVVVALPAVPDELEVTRIPVRSGWHRDAIPLLKHILRHSRR